MQDAPYRLAMPETRDTSVIFASPHSGCDYPASFIGQSPLSASAIRSSEDAFVDRLFADAPLVGAPLLSATAPRAFLDLNRGPDELDPAVVAGAAAHHMNPRITSGLGVIPRVVAGGRAIYRGKIGLDEARMRVATYWRPYHNKLQTLIDESQLAFGGAVLVDCHSMPHEAVEAMARTSAANAEVVLGDRYGAAAGEDITDRIEAAFLRAGFRVVRNTPFAGAYIAQTYGRPARNQHVVQIEIDRRLYMDETTITPLPGFEAFRARITAVLTEIADIGRKPPQRMAAE